jgi:hypothetical protein
MNHEDMEEIKRHFGVVAEGLEGKIQLIAEGVVDLHAKLDREMGALRGELTNEFGEVKAIMKFSYAELDRRLRGVEGEVAALKARLDRVEAGRR